MLITMEKHLGLHILDEVVRELVKMGLDVYVMRKSRPFKIAAFGVNSSRFKKRFGIKSISTDPKDTAYFQAHTEDFESAHIYLSEGQAVPISG